MAARKVVSSAVIKNGTVYALPPPAKHPTILKHFGIDGSHQRGFVLSDGKFATREQAFRVAKAAKQLKKMDQKREQLHSEDVWK